MALPFEIKNFLVYENGNLWKCSQLPEPQKLFVDKKEVQTTSFCQMKICLFEGWVGK